ncbi:MAG: gliding motility-associated C-terminal domain-containing protein [Chitinophagaceae bacterium]|nr:gliding motility-associated C-terminal domain-containing protein [Chitinophagaceae bacterium]
MARIKLLFSLLFIFGATALQAQNISGIINYYATVSAINQNILTVNSTNGFPVGTKVIVIKMKGAQINQTNTAAYGDTITMDEAGKYIFSTVIAVTPTTMTLSPFCNIFNNTQYLQVVSIPVYNNATVTAPLTCQPWNGSTGGVLILESNTLTLNANIDASQLGYRGGDVWGSTFSCNSSTYYAAQVAFGPEGKKGEGVADYIVGQECGRAKLANGGGGAFSGNTGAGGGGNGGKGGDGGFEYNGCGTVNIFSYGGLGINHKNSAILMGGGGGAPQTDNGQTVYNGGNGGAIVYLKANQIIGNGFQINSNGQSTPQINDEGAPAGGAGGSIYLECPLFAGPLTFNANGGNGSSNFNTIFTTNCQGPGGGGGGGLVWFSTAATPAGVTVNTVGGASGMILNPVSTCYNTSYNAQPGDPGVTKYNFVPIPPSNPPVVDLGPDTTICAGTSITLDAGSNFQTYLWEDNSTGQTHTISSPGTYSVVITNQAGCTGTDTIVVTLDNSVNAGFTASIHLGCENDTVVFTNTSTGSTQYVWQFGDNVGSTSTDPTHVYTSQGIYTVTLIASNPPCHDTIQMTIDLNHPIAANFAVSSDSVCLGDNIVASSVSTPLLYLNHSWDWGDGTITNTNPSGHIYSAPGVYTIMLTITDTLGCTDTSSLQVYVEAQPSASFTIEDDQVCLGEPVFLHELVSNVSGFAWDYGDNSLDTNRSNPVHTYSNAGNYTITLTPFGINLICPPSNGSVSLPVTVLEYPRVNLGPDTMICPGVTGAIFITNTFNGSALYEWSTGETSNGISITQPGHYWVKASNGDCITVDSIWVKRDCYINVPNSFSPNGDGLNDYFIPRELLSSGVKTFSMSIFNRWGEKIFTTSAIDGRGWDGKYNGVLQPMGVYVYTMEVEFINNTRKNFSGNVTLVR